MQNRKIVNVKNGVNGSDAVTKSQLDTKTSLLDGARPGYVVNDKAVIYSDTGSVHAQSFYLKDTPDDSGNSNEVRFLTKRQSYENVPVYVPNLFNFDGYGGREPSEMVITSTDQTVTGKKIFQNYCTAQNPINSDHISTKGYVDGEISKISSVDTNQFVKKTADTMTGNLILQQQSYPVQGNTDKAVSYNTTRSIFLSRKEGGAMETDINMNNNFIQNVATPTSSHQATNKGYCDYNFLSRQRGGRIMGSLSMNQNDMEVLLQIKIMWMAKYLKLQQSIPINSF